MCVSKLLWFLTLCSMGSASIFSKIYPRIELMTKKDGNAGEPLILTPFLKNGSIALAQKLSQVDITERLGFRSHSGFFTTNEKYNSNLFFWYFPPFSKDPDAPVLLWLQGGPGGSSLFGLFAELGPLVATKNGFKTRKYHWALNYHLIFIDNPVGTGFSFTNKDDGFCNNEDCVGKGLYKTMDQFFTLFPKLRKNEFFITGESYAGKYLPALGMEIHTQNSKGNSKINLKGLALGNAYCDPLNQMEYGKYLYQHGLIDDNQKAVFEEIQSQIASLIKQENWPEAGFLMDKLMDGDFSNTSYFKNFTGFDMYYNFLQTKNTDDMSIFGKLLQNDGNRRSIHVGGLPFNSGQEVEIHLAIDILKSIANYVSELLSHYRLMFYNGQLDIIVAYPLTEKFLKNLKFSSAEEYKTAKRNIWRVDDDIAGYYKKAGNLTEVLVRNAGHMVPHDQPKWAFDLITKFVKNKI